MRWECVRRAQSHAQACGGRSGRKMRGKYKAMATHPLPDRTGHIRINDRKQYLEFSAM
jgi:hypothetical protein